MKSCIIVFNFIFNYKKFFFNISRFFRLLKLYIEILKNGNKFLKKRTDFIEILIQCVLFAKRKLLEYFNHKR